MALGVVATEIDEEAAGASGQFST